MKCFSKITSAACVLASLLALSGCHTYLSDNDKNTAQDNMTANNNSPSTAIMAEIYRPEISDNNLTFLSISNGCTSAQNFALGVLYLPSDNPNTTMLTVNVVKPDYCKGMPRIVEISMPLTIQIIGSLSIGNPDLPVPQIKHQGRK